MKNFRKIAGCHTVCLLLLLVSRQAAALDTSASATLSVLHTDNVTKVHTNTESDQLVTTSISAGANQKGGFLSGNATASLRHIEWLDNSFGSQNYLGLSSSADWVQLPNRLTWRINDYYTQAQIDNLGVDTPTNTQNVNAFGLSATASFPLFPRHQLQLIPEFHDYNYDESDNDNRQYRLSAAWVYQFRPTIDFSLRGQAGRVRYNTQSNADYDNRTLVLAATGRTSRAVFNGSFGGTHVQRDGGSDTNGVSYSLRLDYDLSGRSTLVSYISSDITDTSSIYMGSFNDPNTGEITNVQSSGDTVRNWVMRIGYNRTGSTVNTSLWTEVRRLNYQTLPIDRDVKGIGGSVSYRMTSGLSSHFTGSYLRTSIDATSEVQKVSLLSAGLGYRLSRRFNLNFTLSHQTRDSDVVANQYDENSVYAGLGYSILP